MSTGAVAGSGMPHSRRSASLTRVWRCPLWSMKGSGCPPPALTGMSNGQSRLMGTLKLSLRQCMPTGGLSLFSVATARYCRNTFRREALMFRRAHHCRRLRQYCSKSSHRPPLYRASSRTSARASSPRTSNRFSYCVSRESAIPATLLPSPSALANARRQKSATWGGSRLSRTSGRRAAMES